MDKNQKYEYHVLIYQESFVSAFLSGGGKVNADNFAASLNGFADDGWRVVTVEKESRRTLLFFQREAFICVLERQR